MHRKWTWIIYNKLRYLVSINDVSKGKEDDDERQDERWNDCIYKANEKVKPQFWQKCMVLRRCECHSLVSISLRLHNHHILQMIPQKGPQSESFSCNSRPSVHHYVRNEESRLHWNGTPESLRNPALLLELQYLSVIHQLAAVQLRYGKWLSAP